MKRQSFKMVLTSGLVFLLLGVTAPLIFAEPVGVNSGIYLSFSGTCFNKHTGEDVDITGKVHVITHLTRNHLFTRVFLKSYDAIGDTTGYEYDITLPPRLGAQPPKDVDKHPDDEIAIYIWSTDQVIKHPPLSAPCPSLLVGLVFDPDGILTGGSTTLNGTTTTCTLEACIKPQ